MVACTQWTSTRDVKAAVIASDGLDIVIIIIIIEQTFEILVIVFTATLQLLFLLLLLLNFSHAIKKKIDLKTFRLSHVTNTCAHDRLLEVKKKRG